MGWFVIGWFSRPDRHPPRKVKKTYRVERIFRHRNDRFSFRTMGGRLIELNDIPKVKFVLEPEAIEDTAVVKKTVMSDYAESWDVLEKVTFHVRSMRSVEDWPLPRPVYSISTGPFDMGIA